ncbi:MAG: ABC transporter ATP-binding protein [Alphaproteobacteria bacterium]|nr:MAG: ABC transporter ATP-binding protein [Alphaproteobacteria bacterium]
MTSLTVRDLAIDLGRRRVVDSVSFDLEPGSLVGLLGPNGAGKTTLLRGLVGIADTTGGNVLVDGVALAAVPAAVRARQIAYLPQGGQVHWPLDVFHTVALGRLPHQTPFEGLSEEDIEAILRALEYTDTLGLAGRPVTELSGGERARVLLARALASEPRILLADEPVAGLDPAHQIDVMHLLRTLVQRGNAAMVVLHDLTLAARYCDRVLVMNEGRIAADGPPDKVLTQQVLEDCFGIKVYLSRAGGELFLVPTARSEAV